MTTLLDLTAYLDDYLAIGEVRDYGPNGLQVEGRAQVRRVALGVSVCLAFIEQAAAWGADALIVHHGLFWRGQGEMRVERSLRARLKLLLERDIGLLAYHLPLDRHPVVGNNAVLARRLGAGELEPAFAAEGVTIGMVARFGEKIPAGELFLRVEQVTARKPLVIEAGPPSIGAAGIVTGGAPRYIEEAARLGLDAFITGEPGEPAVHLAREEGLHFVAAGHHATETFGVQELGAHLRQAFPLETTFIEIPNPA